MRKLISVGLILCILTILVLGVSVVSARSNAKITLGIAESTNAYAASSPEQPAHFATYAYTQLSTNANGITLKGATQAYASGRYAYTQSSSTISGQIGF